MGLRARLKQLLVTSPPPRPELSKDSELSPRWNQGIWFPIVGGLANQLICYRAGRMLANIHDVPLVADLSHFQSSSARPLLLPHFGPAIDIEFRDAQQANPWAALALDLLPLETTRNTPHFWQPDTQTRLRARYLETPNSPILVDLWAGLALQIQASDYFRRPENMNSMRFNTSCLGNLETEMLNRIRSSRNSIAVHVRRTDFAHHDGGLLAPSQQYNEAIRYIEECKGNCEIFIFSDDQAWCEKYISAAGTVCNSPIRGEENGHKDLFLAAECRHKVLTSESTFSQMIDCLSPYHGEQRLIVRCSARVSSPIYSEYEHA